MNSTGLAHTNRELRDAAFRGLVNLPGDEIGIVFEGGRVLVVRGRIRLLDGYRSEGHLGARTVALTEAASELATLGNLTGPSVGDRLSARRSDAIAHRDRDSVRKTVDLTGVEEPAFMAGYEPVGTIGTVEAQARTERLAREVPEVPK